MERRFRVRFAPSEITRMESLVADRKEQVLDENFCQKLAKEFNCSAGRVGSRALQAIQVQGWFLNKFPASITKPTCLPTATEEKALDSQANMLVSETKALASEEKLLALDTSISNNEDEVSPDSPKGTRDKVPELDDLEFEARSAKDSAWYDIDIFLAHRRTNSGEVEVRVRFQGFGAEEDEWVNVRKAIRQRSIPLESSECQSVVEGDLVLCFRERNEEALHFDAHILEIQRKQHDIRGCRCVFLVKYDHDQSQGVYIARALDSILCVINCNTRTEILRHPDLQKLPVFLMPGKGEPEKIVTAAEVLLMAFVIVDLLLAMCAAAYIELTGTSKIVRN